MTTVVIDTTFGDHLRDARKRRGLSQRQLAERLGVSHTTIQYWEGDENLPEAAMLPWLAKNLRVAPSTLGRWLEDSPLRYTSPALTRAIPGYLNDLICALFPARTSPSPLAA